MTWEVRDPQGFKHVLEKDDDGFHGSENLAHGYSPLYRPFVTTRLIFEIEKNPDLGEWNGFAWIKL